jgi:carbonic anhydrase
MDPPSDVLKYHYEPIRNVKLRMRAQKGLLYVDTSDLQIGEVVFGGERYPLVRIDFHAQSEHLLKGKRFAMELQLVHRKLTDPTKSLIIAVPVWSEKVPQPPPVPLVAFVKKPLGTYFPPLETEPDYNSVLQQFLTVRPPWKEGQTSDIIIPMMKPLDLGFFVGNPRIPGTSEYIQYAGSLTTAPCSDVTTWFVRRRPMIASDSQTQAFAESIFKLTNKHGNFRAVMPVNQRVLRVYKAQWVQNLPLWRDPLPLGPNARTDEEFKAEKLADMAKQLSQDSVDYMNDFGNRLRRSARHLNKNLEKANQVLRAGPTEPPKVDEWERAVMKMQNAMETIVGGVKDQVDHDFRHETMRLHKQAAIEAEKAREMTTAWMSPDGRKQGV